MEPSTPAAIDPDETGYQIDDLVVDIGQQRVTRDGHEIPMAHLSLELLLTLARAAPNLVTFDQLIARVWPGLVITPETISQRVKLVRSALGDDPQAPRYIAGVRGRGYRMVAAVRPLRERRRTSEPPPPPSPSPSLAPEPAPEPAVTVVPPPVAAPATAAAPADAGPASSAAPRTRALPPVALWAGGGAALALLIVITWFAGRSLHPGSATPAAVVVQPPRTIAVLPLVDMSPGDGNSYLGEGLAQELSARLARVRGLRVASHTSATAFKNRGADVRTIAQALGVRHVLEGSIHREGDQLRVTAQLIDAFSGYDVWSQTYNRTWADLLAIEDDVARSITTTLQVVLTSDRAGSADRPSPARVEAFDHYLAGLAKLQGPDVPARLDEAEASFRQALRADPQFALAYAGLCQRYVRGYELTRDAALVPQAEASCNQALKLDASLREVSGALAQLYLVSGRHAQAGAIYREAIRADPDDADGYIGLGEALDGQQRTAEAERALRQGVAAEPTYWNAQTALANFLFAHGRAAEALPVYRRVTELIPASPMAFNNLGAAQLMSGDFKAAAPVFERSLALEPTRSAYSNAGTVYYYLGRYGEAARLFTRATELAGQDHRVWGNLADALWQSGGGHAAAQADYRRATELARQSLKIDPKDAVSWMQLAYYRTRAGERDGVDADMQQALTLNAEDMNVQYYAALIALERHETDAALSALAHAVELGFPAQLVRAAPDFASLRGEARFKQLSSAGGKTLSRFDGQEQYPTNTGEST